MQHKLTAAFALLLTAGCALAQAQQACPLPITPAPRDIVFSPAVEEELGRVVSAQIEVQLRLINDPELLGPLRRMGERLARELPPGTPTPQFFLVESGIANAVTMPGARIYVMRKLITQTRSEDELASVLAHELGHVVARAPEVTLSRMWRVVLNKTSVTDPAEIEGDFHHFLDTIASHPKIFTLPNTENEDQRTADEIGVWLLARAGYNPQALGDWFGRFTDTSHHTGDWLTDLFGITKPNARRLRDILHVTSSIPANCIDRTPMQPASDFAAWQQKVIAYQYQRQESVHGVLWSRQLSPRLQAEIEYVRFSPDGTHALAQTETNIFVLTRDPFAVQFTISAPDAYHAQFTPDSRQIVFRNSEMRVESWDVASEKRVAVHELFTLAHCIDSELSPDGANLACVAADPQHFFPFRLVLLDVATGAEVFQKAKFYDPAIQNLGGILNYLRRGDRPPFVTLRFSPDGKYLVASRPDAYFAVDVQARQELKLPATITRLLWEDFDFAGPGRIFSEGSRGRAQLLTFPGGEPVYGDLQLGTQRIEGVTRGDYVMLRPIRKFTMGLLDLKKGRVLLGNRDGVFDTYGEVALATKTGGALALLALNNGLKELATVNLPSTELGGLRTATLSHDFTRLAISESRLGAVWDLKTGQQLARVRGFRGSYFGDDGNLFVLFPPREYIPGLDDKSDDAKKDQKGSSANGWSRPFSVATVDLASNSVSQEKELPEDIAPMQIGRYVVSVRGVDKYALKRDRILEVRDMHSEAVLWSSPMKSPPYSTVPAGNDFFGVMWMLDSPEGREQSDADPVLKERGRKLAKGGAYLLNVYQAHDGMMIAKFLLDTGGGSFRPGGLFVTGSRVLLVDSDSRVLVYSLQGEPQGHLFGSYAIGSQDGRMLCVEDKPGHLEVFDAATLRKKNEFTFSSSVVMARFSPDGKELGVLTADETFYALSTTAGSSSQAAK